MRTSPLKCRDENVVEAFCDCIGSEESVDKAAQAFCRRPSTGSDRNASGDDLRELKKALMDLEDD